MISDVLAEAVGGINSYLRNPQYDDMYSGWIRTEIVRIRNDMLAMGGFLDTPPDIIEKEVPAGETEEYYYKQLKEKCAKLEAVYPGVVAASDD